MLGVDRDALLCDLAETYHIFDLRALPVTTLAALSFGLRDDSRIKMKLAGVKYVPEYVLLASICDNISMLRYNLMASEEDPLPPFYIDIILGKDKQDTEKEPYTAEDFERDMADIARRANNG